MKDCGNINCPQKEKPKANGLPGVEVFFISFNLLLTSDGAFSGFTAPGLMLASESVCRTFHESRIDFLRFSE